MHQPLRLCDGFLCLPYGLPGFLQQRALLRMVCQGRLGASMPPKEWPMPRAMRPSGASPATCSATATQSATKRSQV